MKKIELLAATALSLFVATPAFAQDTPAPATQTADEEDSANEIVVTATLRNETVQDVPIAVTALPAQLLENSGVRDIRNLEQLAPSLQTTTGQSAATSVNIAIRGINTAGDNPGYEPAVGVFIDGVFRSRAGVAIAELPELERVEVLRGPQGTLFGRNTSAGALRVFTAMPKFELGGYVEGSYGNYDAWSLRGAITGPVTEQLALRLDGGVRKRDGYIQDANSDRRINNIDRYNLRAQALLDTGDVTFRFIADYYKTDEACCGAVSVARGNIALIQDAIAGAQGLDGIYTGPPSDRIQAISPNRGYSEQVKDYGFSGELNWDLGDVKLTSITAYRRWKGVRDQDIDFSGVDRAYRDDYTTRITDFTQELRLQGSAFGGTLDWLVGGFFLNEKLTLHDTVRLGNDANRYVDSIVSTLLGAPPAAGGFGTQLQFFGSLPGVPLFGQAIVNPAVPTAAFGAAAPLVACFRAQAGTGAPAACPIPGYPTAVVPGLLGLVTSPLPNAVPGQGNTDDFRVKTNAFALFTHNIIDVGDGFKITLGARWNHEKKKLDATIFNNTGSCAFFYDPSAAAQAYRGFIGTLSPGLSTLLRALSCNPAVNTALNGSYNDKRSENRVTGTVRLSWEASDRLMIYGGYDRGYKSGGYNLDQAVLNPLNPLGSDLQFGAETVNSFEVGLKYSPNRVFTVNVAGFYGDYKDLQNLAFSGTNFVAQNINAKSKGIEIEAIVRPVNDLSLRLGYTYNEATYGKDRVLTGSLAGLEGEQIENQPRHIATASVDWTPDIGGLKGLLHVDSRLHGPSNIEGFDPVTGLGAVRNPTYVLVNAVVGIGTQDGKIRGELFVENLTNVYYNITGFPPPEQQIPGLGENYAGYPGYPRFYGARLRFGF